LIERLHTSVPLILLAAGAGFGKSTLLSTWAHLQREHVAWLTLDEQDNDPLRFWAYVLLALRNCAATLGDAASGPPHTTEAAELPALLISPPYILEGSAGVGVAPGTGPDQADTRDRRVGCRGIVTHGADVHGQRLLIRLL
jgi:hypothetical protein